jgi:hypothetical protein
MSSSSEVIFHGGRLHELQSFENCFGLYLSRPTNVTKHDLLISSYLSHLQVRSFSMQVIFHVGRLPCFLKIVFVSRVDLRMLQSMFCLFPAI